MVIHGYSWLFRVIHGYSGLFMRFVTRLAPNEALGMKRIFGIIME